MAIENSRAVRKSKDAQKKGTAGAESKYWNTLKGVHPWKCLLIALRMLVVTMQSDRGAAAAERLDYMLCRWVATFLPEPPLADLDDCYKHVDALFHKVNEMAATDRLVVVKAWALFSGMACHFLTLVDGNVITLDIFRHLLCSCILRERAEELGLLACEATRRIHESSSALRNG
jgi:hypothetical protein